MLTKMTIRNFKQFEDVAIELGNPVVFIGPNNSGKTTALQALTLWHLGLKRWLEKYSDTSAIPAKRPGVTVNRRDLNTLPVSNARLLWRNLSVRLQKHGGGKNSTENVRIDITVEGVTDGTFWKCGLEFDYANSESFYCRPLRLDDNPIDERMPIPKEAATVKVAFLPPMSGLSDREHVKLQGEIDFLIGQGKTAEILRNLCFQIVVGDQSNQTQHWQKVRQEVQKLFGISLNHPRYIPERSEIELTYQDHNNVTLDISSSGRGLQQTLLLLAYLAVNPNAILLLDEPDAHLEILRQRQIYQLLTNFAQENSSQILIASHSEVILNEAADRDVVIAFLGRQPHRIDDRGSQLVKALKHIGFEQYYQAQQTGWVLYLEGSTDLAMLQSYAHKLGHPAVEVLKRPFIHYVANQPTKVYDHFFALREAHPQLIGFALFDQLAYDFRPHPALTQYMWQKREFENYLCQEETLLAWATTQNRFEVMEESIREIREAMETLGKGSPWDKTTKVSDDFLTPLFRTFYKKLSLPNLMQKTDYHTLVPFVPTNSIDPEIRLVLDQIVTTAQAAHLPQS